MWTSKELNGFAASYRSKFKRCQGCNLHVDNRNHKRHVKACMRKKREARAKQHEQWLKDFKAGTLTPREAS